jgi:UDPglucose--hexose-1-phosphate uridylyltransferase
MKIFNLEDHPHRRLNALTGEWVLVSPHRAKRPWQGQQEDLNKEVRPHYDSTCYLCPTNERANGDHNPDYKNTFVFENDFGALQATTPAGSYSNGNLIKAESERGISKVICFSPRHDQTLADMEVIEIRRVVDLWQQEYEELGKLDFINYVQIFENKGSVMGSSNPHPHGQIWAQSAIPNEVAKEAQQQENYYRKYHKSLLQDYVTIELEENKRIVCQNDSFIVVVPFWAVWPFETIIISTRHFQHIGQMTQLEKDNFASIIKQITAVYDKVFHTSFPYSAGIHQQPTDGHDHPAWHFHMHFFPPLLRSANIKKFMVGYEMLGGPQRDITPETSAARLRALV